MMTRRERKTKSRRIALIRVVAVLLVMVRMIPSQAATHAKLSRTKRTYDMTGLWDKLKLRNIPSKAKIRWSSTDPKVVKIRERKGTCIWYEVVGEGKARIVAKFNSKKLSCRISVKIKKEPMETIAPTPDSVDSVSGVDPAEPSPTMETPRIPAPETTHTPTPTTSPTPQTTKITFRQQVEDKMEGFITSDMSEYDKMVAIVKHVSNDYDYELGQYDFEIMFRTGKGDCMASRYLVAYMARAAGLMAFPIPSVDAHGETLVRAGDTVYMTITGTNMPRPRTYLIYEETMENLKRLENSGNPSLLKKLGF